MQSIYTLIIWVIPLLFPLNLIFGQEFTPIEKEVINTIDSVRSLYIAHEYSAGIKMIDEVDLQALNNDSLKLELFYRASVSHMHLGNYSKKFEYAVRGLELAKKLNDEWMIASLYRQIGSVMDYPIGDTEGALKYLKKANEYSGALDSMSQCGLLLDIGQTSGSAAQHDSAEFYFQKAFNHMTADSSMWFDACNFYTGYLVYNEFYDKAEPYVKYVLEESKRSGFINGTIGAEANMAWIEHARKNYKEALAYADQALAKANEIDSDYYILLVLEIRSEILKEYGTKDQRIQSLQEYIDYEQAYEKAQGSDSLLQLKVKFETQEFQTLLAKLSDSNQALQTTSSITKKVASVLGLALIGFGIFTFLRSRQRKAHIADLQRQFESTKKDRLKLQEEYEKAIEQLELKKRELTSTALFIQKKNEALKSVRKLLEQLNLSADQAKNIELRSAKKIVDSSVTIDNNWEAFRYYFEQLHPAFIKNVKSQFPKVTQNDLRCLAYIKMGLTDKEIARILGITTASFQKFKYRLNKKLNAANGTKVQDIIERTN